MLVIQINYQTANSSDLPHENISDMTRLWHHKLWLPMYFRKSHWEVILSFQAVHLKIIFLSRWNFLLIVINVFEINCKGFPFFLTLQFRPYYGSCYHVLLKFCPTLACRSHQNTLIICIRVQKKTNQFVYKQPISNTHLNFICLLSMYGPPPIPVELQMPYSCHWNLENLELPYRQSILVSWW